MEQCIKSVTFEVRKNTWMKNISDRNASGLSIKDWCAMHGVRETSYYYWLKKMRTEALGAFRQKEETTFVPLLPGPQSKKTTTLLPNTKADMNISQGDLIITFGEQTSFDVILNILKVMRDA